MNLYDTLEGLISIIEFNIVKLGINLYSYEAVSLEEYKKDQLNNSKRKRSL